MGRVECPACYALVVARSDGACPSCGGDTRGKKSALVRMRIGEGTVRPDGCASCAGAATRTVEVRQVRKTGSGAWGLTTFLRLLALISGVFIFGRIFRRMALSDWEPEQRGQLDRLVIDMPMCTACAKAGAPRVL